VSADFTTEYGNCLNVPVETFNTPTPNVTETSAPTLTPLPTDTPAATLTPALPDLIITSITGEETLALGNDGEVISEYAVTIANVGLGASASFEVALDVILGTETTTLDAGVVSELGVRTKHHASC
jgi:hypothetical protein